MASSIPKISPTLSLTQLLEEGTPNYTNGINYSHAKPNEKKITQITHMNLNAPITLNQGNKGGLVDNTSSLQPLIYIITYVGNPSKSISTTNRKSSKKKDDLNNVTISNSVKVTNEMDSKHWRLYQVTKFRKHPWKRFFYSYRFHIYWLTLSTKCQESPFRHTNEEYTRGKAFLTPLIRPHLYISPSHLHPNMNPQSQPPHQAFLVMIRDNTLFVTPAPPPNPNLHS